MSSTLNGTLAAALLAATTLGNPTDVEAGRTSRIDQQAENRANVQTCYQVGREKGVSELPLTKKAYQQDRDSGVGCIFIKAAGGEFVVQKAFDLNDGRSSNNYGRELDNLEKREQRELTRLTRQNGGRRDQSGNPVQDAAKGATDTMREVQRTSRGVHQGVRTLESTSKSIKRTLDILGF